MQISKFSTARMKINQIPYVTFQATSQFSLKFCINFQFLLQPSRVTTNSKTLIDNIFSNMAVPNIISGSLAASISDHLPQFLVAPNIF